MRQARVPLRAVALCLQTAALVTVYGGASLLYRGVACGPHDEPILVVWPPFD
jgi:hypothetical protein